MLLCEMLKGSTNLKGQPQLSSFPSGKKSTNRKLNILDNTHSPKSILLAIKKKKFFFKEKKKKERKEKANTAAVTVTCAHTKTTRKEHIPHVRQDMPSPTEYSGSIAYVTVL